MRLLIVDDDPTALQTLRAHLARPGYSVVEANNGALALELLAQQEFDVIVVDGMMPGLDGFETCQRIKDSPDWEQIPVVMITALDSQRDRNAGLRSGADDFLSKPVNGTELRLRLQSLGKVEAYHDLLDNVLPAHIARRLRNDPGYAADSVEAATILFSDIKGFVPFSMGRSAASASRTTCGATL